MAAAKLRGHRKLDVIRDLAMQAASQHELSVKYGVTDQAMSHFARDFAPEIEELRNALITNVNDEAAATQGLWIADKVRRVAEYQQDVDDINERLAIALDDRLLKIKHSALRAVAEELAQLPQRGTAQVGEETVIAYTIAKPQDLPS